MVAAAAAAAEEEVAGAEAVLIRDGEHKIRFELRTTIIY